MSDAVLAVAVHTAIYAAAGMQELVQGSARSQNIIKVDPSGSVSYQQGDCCIIFALSGIQAVRASGLPANFITVRQAKLNTIVYHMRRRLGDPLPAASQLYHLYRPPGPEPSASDTSLRSRAFSPPSMTHAQYLLLLILAHAQFMINDDAGAFMHQRHTVKSKKSQEPRAALIAWLCRAMVLSFSTTQLPTNPPPHKKQRSN